MTYSGFLTGFEFFSTLTDEELSLVGATGREVTYQAGQRLFHEGTHARGCWVIERGLVDIDDGTVVVDSLGPGDVIGWSWLLPPHLWHFGAVTVSDVSAVYLDTDRLSRFLDSEPELGYRFVKKVCEVLLRRLQAARRRSVLMPTEVSEEKR
ncbi:MAG TPA: cyclic nucleotide-binding domain-containing protein [Stackebrandtia sp.]|jgi:CRP-like cAMP-binding protein|uniref:Crp/Fnr family transcriptional regulator n=1 Tax=Stackebrandtia sp. TaxID=2023065 RepID=UPI002D2355DD|nr:cyclic nucleotide-binding domain-containing protein [Stackebrandtia sp.]HZE38334.1 cyclic nucleotide-binding domain-containing protein [Stackebrandtia sp.]